MFAVRGFSIVSVFVQARNIACCVEMRDSDGETAKGLKVIHIEFDATCDVCIRFVVYVL